MAGKEQKTGGARNHHFVPQFYLKGFAAVRSQSAQLVTYDLEKVERFVTRPRNLAAKRDYNRIDREGVDPDVVEKQLSKLEHEGDQAFRRIIDSQSVANPADLAQVLALLARLFLSNPLFRDRRDELMREVARTTMHLMVESEERWNSIVSRARADGISFENEVPFAEMRDAVISERIVPVTLRETLIQQEWDLWGKIIPILEGRCWTLIVSDSSTGEFATSDRPAIIYWDDPSLENTIYSPGLGCTGTTVLFPLSKYLCLVGKFGEGGGALVALPLFVAAVNLRVLGTASRQVYCATDFPIVQQDGSISPFSQSELWLSSLSGLVPADGTS